MAFRVIFDRRSRVPSKCAFLDRDGVINSDLAYVFRKEDFHFLPDVFPGLRLLREKGYKLVVVTNQSGIGRGKYTREQFESLCMWMQGVLAREGCALSAIYYCPHHPEKALSPYLGACSCRKPETGMIVQAGEELNLDLQNSLLIGDKPSDIECARRAGIPNRFLVPHGDAHLDTDIECRRVRTILEVAKQI